MFYPRTPSLNLAKKKWNNYLTFFMFVLLTLISQYISETVLFVWVWSSDSLASEYQTSGFLPFMGCDCVCNQLPKLPNWQRGTCIRVRWEGEADTFANPRCCYFLLSVKIWQLSLEVLVNPKFQAPSFFETWLHTSSCENQEICSSHMFQNHVSPFLGGSYCLWL